MRFRSLEREFDAAKAKARQQQAERREFDKLMKAERRYESPLPALRKQAGEVLHSGAAALAADNATLHNEIHKLLLDARVLRGQATILANRVGVSAQNAPSTITLQ